MAELNGGVAIAPQSAPDTDETSQETSTMTPTGDVDEQAIDDTFAALKTLLSTVEKLQKARQSVGDIKPLLIRLLDGEMLSGEELEDLKGGIGGLGKLVKLYSDYQSALEQAQPARELLDDILKTPAKAEV
ncbi:MAG: hypothetical protein O2890_15435 [Cyanobacteria bacterium]|nr:hypothetical protein [Cyanobacteriota bacterium]MDA0867762.1 hypothetical protein [Cyanobacteriota bacterium]